MSLEKVTTAKLSTLTGHRDCIYALTPGEQPQFFFSAGGDGLVVQWDLQNPESGKLIARLPNSIYALHYLTGANLLVVGQNHEGIHLLDWKTGQEVRSLQLGPTAIFDIQSLGNDLIVATGDGAVTVIDLHSWSVRKKITASDKSARTIAVNPGAGEFAVGYSDHFIRVFDSGSFRLQQEWKAHENSVFTLRYAPDFKTLLSGARDARFKVWHAPGYTLVTEVVAHLYAINNIDFSPNGKHFVTCSLDKSIKVWDAAHWTLLKVIDKARHAGHGTSVNKLLWSSFNNQLVSASDDRTMSVWDLIFSPALPD